MSSTAVNSKLELELSHLHCDTNLRCSRHSGQFDCITVIIYGLIGFLLITTASGHFIISLISRMRLFRFRQFGYCAMKLCTGDQTFRVGHHGHPLAIANSKFLHIKCDILHRDVMRWINRNGKYGLGVIVVGSRGRFFRRITTSLIFIF